MFDEEQPDMILPETEEEEGGDGGTYDVFPNEQVRISICSRRGQPPGTCQVFVEAALLLPNYDLKYRRICTHHVTRDKLNPFLAQIVGELRFVEHPDDAPDA